jgi:hypothetical protein
MKKPVKGPGMWTPDEDTALRRCVRAEFTPAEAARRLNRLERSVILRAAILKTPFLVA